MANRIYTNGEEGKILTSVGNRIIKQPYEFGNAFQNRMGLNNYIQISGLNLSMIHTSSIFTGGQSEGTYDMPIYNMQDSNLDNFSGQLETAGTRYCKFLKNNAGSNQLVNFLAYKVFTGASMYVGFIINASKNNQTIDKANTFVSQTSVQTYDNPINKIWISAYRGSNGATPSKYALSTQKFSTFSFYSRAISQGEANYTYNNGLGSEPQSSLNLEIYLKNNFAEILDFSTLQNGSDMRVGCRDYSGYNRHGEIMNLPAGDLTQKVDYANANLFVPFN